MSVKSELDLPWWKKFLLRTISCGPKINHLAVVMDGNRRFARKLQQNPSYGHEKGSYKFLHLVEMARLAGIQELTVYAFSVENFKRSKQEVDEFMQILLNVLQGMFSNVDQYNAKGIRFRFFGELHMVIEENQELFQLLTDATAGNSDFVCNIAIAYSSSNEITKGIVSVLKKVQTGELSPENINETTLEQFFYIPEGRPVDLWIRTSGETRLSDFLTWQSDSAYIYFASVYWPDFGILSLLRAILHYQSNRMFKK